MQTRCPACQTLYRIDEDVLKRAGGQARCFRCDTVFDAYRSPADELDLSVDEADANPVGDTPLVAESEGLSELSALDELPEVPDADGFEPDSELDLDDLADNLRRFDPPSPEPPAQPGIDADSALAPLPVFNALDELPELAADEPAATFDEPPPPQRVTDPALLRGAVAVVLLLALALAQLAWFNRDQVLATPLGQGVAQALCGVFDCVLPARRAPSRYTVLDRNIGADSEQPGALLLQLSFRNGADFAQPLPDIQLSLYDSEEQLMARRRLQPDEYLLSAPAGTTLVAPDEVVQVSLKLEDPGRHATGFKLEFL